MVFKGYIFIECKTDKALVLKIVSSKRFVRCAGGIGEVCNKLKDSENSCGLVDEDPTKSRPRYMINLLNDPSSIVSNEIVIAHDKVRNNYLIVLRPDRKGWLIKTAKMLGIDLRQFDLPNDSNEFKKVNLIKPKKVDLPMKS